MGMRWPVSWSTLVRSASPSSSRSWTSGIRRLLSRGSPPGTAGCCPVSATARSRHISSPGVNFISRGYREGVEVKQVNPAFSSVVGRVKFRVKFMERYGLSVHQAAALVLARRLLGCSERIPHRWVAPIGNGVHVAFTVPERKRVKHVWTYWGAVLVQLRPALAAQHRQGMRLGNWRKPRPQSGSGCPTGPGPGGGVSGDQNGVPW